MIITIFSSCQKNDFINHTEEDESITNTKSGEDPFLDSGNDCLSDEDFQEILDGIIILFEELRDESIVDLSTKNTKLKKSLAVYEDNPVSLCELSDIYQNDLLISSEATEKFLNTLLNYNDIITSENFAECFVEKLINKYGIDTFDINQSENTNSNKWFLATLADALGAGPCVTGPLAVIDTVAYIGTGIFTAPTGIGAIACWGGAVASYGYAISSLFEDC